MAWNSHGKDNVDLVETLKANGLIKADRVFESMKKVDRGNYVRSKFDAYFDSPASIGCGATISAPHMHAYACENLLPLFKPDARVLDVGSGSGYICAVFHHLAGGKDSIVIGVDHVSQLVTWSVENLQRDGLESAVEDGRIRIVEGDGRLGFPEHAPYDVIHVGAAAPELPQALLDQLASPGRMFIPIGDGEQDVWQVDKDAEGNVKKEKLFSVRYVPLTDRQKQYPT